MTFYHITLPRRACSYVLQPFLTSLYQLIFQIHGTREQKLREYLKTLFYCL